MLKKKDFSYFFVRLYQLDLYLKEKIDKGERLRTGLNVLGRRNASELDIVVGVAVEGMRKAVLTKKERAKLKKMKQDLYKKYG